MQDVWVFGDRNINTFNRKKLELQLREIKSVPSQPSSSSSSSSQTYSNPYFPVKVSLESNMLFNRFAILASMASMAMASILPTSEHSDLVKRGPPNGLTGIQTRCTKSKCVSLTFDDGPYINMKKIVDTADAAGIKVTFFVNANNYDCIYHPDRVSDLKYAFSHGHQICSHTTSHPDLNTLTNAQIKTQMTDVNVALWKILGVETNCARPPYGDANDNVVKYLNSLGYVIITWNFDTQDADGATVQFSENVIDGIKAPKHAIVLMHETVNTTANTLFPYAINKLQQNGYTKDNFYTVPAGLGFNGYKKVGSPQQRDSTWTCDNMPQPGAN